MIWPSALTASITAMGGFMQFLREISDQIIGWRLLFWGWRPRLLYTGSATESYLLSLLELMFIG